MPALDLGGGLTVTSVDDATAIHPLPLEDAFPGDAAGGWDAVAARFPETVADDGRWRLPMFAFLVRRPGLTVLVDTGSGDARTVSAKTFGVVGALPDRLAALGVGPDEVDVVLFTHLHQDHVGWAADTRTGAPTFPRARYLLGRAEREANPSTRAPSHVTQSIEPLERAGVVEVIEPGRVAEGIEMVALPGHSPGHCAIVVTGASGVAALVGDAFNHPEQVADPRIPSVADVDRDRAVASRREVLARSEAGDWPTLGSAHLPGAWWTTVRAEQTPSGRAYRRLAPHA